MLKPSFRLFIIPLGAVCTLASLSAQNVSPRAHRDTGSMLVREQVIDCSTKKSPGGLRDLPRQRNQSPLNQFLL
jgi:hypothetical protein